MAVLEALNEGQIRVEEFREALGKVRHALDNTDAALAAADEGLELAEEVIEEARKAMPLIITATAVLTAAGVGIYFWRKHAKASKGKSRQ